MWIWDQFFTFFNTGRYYFFTIYCHSPGGDTAAALSDIAFYTTYFHRVTVQWPWQSLRSLSALVFYM